MRDGLAAAARAAFDGGRELSGRELSGVERLRGGSKKGVYRLAFENGRTAIAYLWSAEENFWPGGTGEDSDPLSHASGLALFEAAHAKLTGLGLRTPELYLADRTGSFLPADLAIVEDVPGENLEALLDRDPAAAEPVLARLGELLGVLARHTSPTPGKLAWLADSPTGEGRSCEAMVLDRAFVDLAEAAGRDARIAAARPRLAESLHRLAEAVRPRAEHAVVHGELGPDHVLVDAAGQPVLIDIEGLMHFDVEWEHAFLRIRFHEHHARLVDPARPLDEDRLALYTLAMRLSLVAGPLRLLDGGFPDRALMAEIAEHNLREALLLV
ncbi:phosphotransferase family protein [Kitasatospora sp. McL0602]|uniref:phosphotransferase family protein n=1 Tax=Kitasatospora sp. McL0602 TaxID=3439530 RepID=UPI003F8A8AA5